MKKYLSVGVLVLLFAMPLAAAEKESVKIKLPDGIYMYDSWIEKLSNGCISIRYEKFFFVKNNIIYSSKDALKKFGTVKINEPFLKEKKHKILLGGEKIGEIYNLRIDDGHKKYEEKLFTKAIKEGPAYGSGGYGSAVRYMAVPEEYKEVKKKVYATITQEEIDRVAKLAQEKLFPLVKNIEALKRCKILETELVSEKMSLLDKISVRNNEMYIGIYKYAFRSGDKALGRCDFTALFSAREDNVNAITINYEYGMASLFEGEINICGMLDIDGCGADELIIEKQFGGEAELTINLEIYKQKADGKWSLIKKIKD
jgi:hypothetical protein